MENKVHIAFYKAFDASGRTFWDWLIAKLDGSDTSHCEIITNNVNSLWWEVEGCHAMRGGVSKASILASKQDWRVYSIQENYSNLEPYTVLEGTKYDWPGTIKTKIDWFPHFKNRTVCSTYIARRIGLDRPWSIGVKDLEDHIASIGTRII